MILSNYRVLRRRKRIIFSCAKYNSGDGVFGHRPTQNVDFALPQEIITLRNEQSRVQRLIEAYRKYGHLKASINNVNFDTGNQCRYNINELEPEIYGLSPETLADTKLLYGHEGETTVSGLTDILVDKYCGYISYEFMYLDTQHEREWFSRRVEGSNDTLEITRRVDIAKELLQSQAWDRFLSVKYPTVKRYCGEGSETLLTVFSSLFRLTTANEVKHIVIGMAHRGKLNVMTTCLQYPPKKIFHKFNGNPEFPEDVNATCDISTHLNTSVNITVNNKTVHVSLMNNPSHLEAVNPVSMGKTRSKQMELIEGNYSTSALSRQGDKILNLQVHGDAAFTGQGVNQETLMLSQVPHFHVGGSLHVVVNNQLGFTLPADRSRTGRYVTDLAKTIAAPVIHVNGDHPELVERATSIAFEYQREFRKDVFVDLNCFRRWGHNEMDDPTFTNPRLYNVIHNRLSIPDLYTSKLLEERVINTEDVERITSEYTSFLQSEFKAATSYKPEISYYQSQWGGINRAPKAVEIWDTGVDRSTLKLVGNASVRVPDGFNIHPHLAKAHLKNRLSRIAEETKLDWATAEALAIGSLLMDGRHVRLSGEDVGRGTFSHRHVTFVDQLTDHMHVPLNYITHDQKGFLEVANSILSEEAVLGFEYGMASDSPNNLIIWEAQFGDFYNGAQIIVDQFIASGEAKWMRSNGLVMLLPHGMDGAGPEHSSCRIERFLQLSDSAETIPDGEDINLHVVNPTTPHNYFHLLRRQMVRNYRKPLVVASPKLLLRLPEAVSSLNDFLPGTYFRTVIGDPIPEPLKVKRVVLVSGKHYYDLHKERTASRVENVAILRLEALSPFPLQALGEELKRFPNARTFIWSQEEHRNMGAWSFVKPRFENLLGKRLIYSGRGVSAAPAVGAASLHRAELRTLITDPLYNVK